MADNIVMWSGDDERRAQSIFEAFSEETGLDMIETAEGVEFPLGPDDHRIRVVETLNEIDPAWAQFIALGDPRDLPEDE